MQTNYLATRIWVISVFLSVLSITILCLLWLNEEKQTVEQAALQDVVQQKTFGIHHLADLLNQQVNTAFILGHSLALRQSIMTYTQDILQKTSDVRKSDLASEIGKWVSSDRDSEEFQHISTSLEAVFLRDVIDSSESIIDEIVITDALGFVRIASHSPEELYVFDNEWWQRTLKLQPGQIYRFYSTGHEYAEYLHLCLPLYNDEGKDPVGVIRLRLQLEQLFSSALIIGDHRANGICFITDDGHVYPDIKPDGLISISDVKFLTKRTVDVYPIPDRSLAFASGSLSGRIPSLLPNLDWTVAAYAPIPRVTSFYHPVFHRVLMIWLAAIAIIMLVSYQLAAWISQPFFLFIKGIRVLSKGVPSTSPFGSEKSSLPDLAEIENQLFKTMEQTSMLATKSLRESMASLEALSDMTQEAALEYDRRIIAESLLRISVRKFNADAGVLLIHNPDYKSPMKLQFNLTDEQINSYTSLILHDAPSKKIYFSWDHMAHETVWRDGFQVIVSVPVRTRQSKFGTMYLLFQKAVETDFEKDTTLDLLAQQCAVYTSRSGLFHELDRQISFTEGVLSGIPWFICAIDSQMKITWHNNRKEIRFFNDMEKLIGTKCCLAIRGRDSICPDCPVKQTIHDCRAHEVTQQWIGPSGETQWVKLNSFPLKDETGQMRSAILFIHDISSEIETHSEIRRFARAIDCIGEAVIITDMEGRIVFTNKAFSRIFQYSEIEVKGHRIELLFPTEDAGIHKKITAAINWDRIWMMEMEMLKRDDQRIPASLTASLVIDETGNAIGKVITCFDLSVRLQREKQVIQHYKELEILHKINQLLIQTPDLREVLQQILSQIATFTGCQSGAVLLYDPDTSDERRVGNLLFDPRKPGIITEMSIPGYFAKFVEEFRQGRESPLLQRLGCSSEPMILNSLQSETSIESKLFTKMGFHAMLAIPVRSQSVQLGILFLFSSHSFHFQHDNLDIYNSIATQVGISLYARFLQERLLRDARYILTGEILARIGGDVRQVVQGLEASRHLVEKAIRIQSWSGISGGWDTLNRQIWQLYQLNLNILAYGSEDQKLFFPENINHLVKKWISQFKSLSFTEKIPINFTGSQGISDVYINKVTIQRAFTNLLTLTVDACSSLREACIDIRILESSGGSEFYAIDLDYTHSPNNHLGTLIQNKRDILRVPSTETPDETPLLLSEAFRCIADHKGQLMNLTNDSWDKIRIVLPRYPVRSA
ncbi:PAS domain-containing protein [bacterium]|nr:PAS domain-containing protein [candidate division CSSED10-310 bacterium]